MSRSKKNWDHLVNPYGEYDFGATVQKGERGPVGARGPAGPYGPQGVRGPKGDRGEPANLWVWMGNVPGYDSLPPAAPGTNGHTYFVDETNLFYVSNGDYSYLIIENFDHVKGDKGEPGITEPGGDGVYGREAIEVDGEVIGQWNRAVALAGDTMEGRLNVPELKVGPNDVGHSQILMEAGETHVLEAIEEEGQSTMWEAWVTPHLGPLFAVRTPELAYGNGFYLAGGSKDSGLVGLVKKNLAISVNGKDWSSFSAGSDDINYWQKIKYGGGRYLLAGTDSLNDTKWYRTFNGEEFVELISVNQPDDVKGLHYSVGRWVCTTGVKSTPVWLSDDNGVTWRLPGDSSLLQAEYHNFTEIESDGNGKWVALDTHSNEIATSFDNGENWTIGDFNLLLSAQDPTTRLSGLAYGNNLWVVSVYEDVGAESNDRFMYYSADGVHWTGVILPLVKHIEDVTFGDGVFVTCGRSESSQNRGVFLVSENGVDWQGHSAPYVSNGTGWDTVLYGNNLWLLGSNSNPASSSLAYLDVVTTTTISGLYYDDALVATRDNLQPVFQQIVENTQAIQGLVFESTNVISGTILPTSTVTGDPHPDGTLFFYIPTTSLYIRHEGIWLKLTN